MRRLNSPTAAPHTDNTRFRRERVSMSGMHREMWRVRRNSMDIPFRGGLLTRCRETVISPSDPCRMVRGEQTACCQKFEFY